MSDTRIELSEHSIEILENKNLKLLQHIDEQDIQINTLIDNLNNLDTERIELLQQIDEHKTIIIKLTVILMVVIFAVVVMAITLIIEQSQK